MNELFPTHTLKTKQTSLEKRDPRRNFQLFFGLKETRFIQREKQFWVFPSFLEVLFNKD
jgi:hypothetical protein